MIRKILIAAKGLSLMLCCVLLTVFSQGSREGAANGIKLCLNVLVPSLFPFMALTNLFAQTGLCQKLGKPLNKLTQKLLGLSGAAAPVILMSLIGGYPVGAAGIAQLRRQNALSGAEAEQAALFAVCAGPGFVISFAGAGLFGSVNIGLIIFAAQAISVLLTAPLARLLRRKEEYSSEKELSSSSSPFSQALVGSVYSAAKSMLTICAFVLLFSAFSGILLQMLPGSAFLTAAAAMLEVSSGIVMLSRGSPVEAAAFLIGFGGICVHFQIFAALGEVRVSKALFFVFRIIQGLLTASLTHIGLRLLPQKEAVFSTSHIDRAAVFGGSVLSGAALIGVTICFLASVKQAIKKQ